MLQPLRSNERSQIRLPPIAEEPRLHRRGRAHARAGHRGEYSHLQRSQRSRSPAASLQNPDRLVQVFSQNEKTGTLSVWNSPPDFVDLKSQSKTFEEVVGWRPWDFIDRQDEEPVRVKGAAISTNLFAMLGVQPFLGRTFFPEEAQ